MQILLFSALLIEEKIFCIGVPTMFREYSWKLIKVEAEEALKEVAPDYYSELIWMHFERNFEW